jgi:hypothetical protein
MPTLLSPIDDPEATLEALAGRAVPGCYGTYSEIMKEVEVRPDSPFGVVMPRIILSRKEGHPSQRWSAFIPDFHCGWYGATPREALLTLYEQWWVKSGRDYALERIHRVDVMVERLLWDLSN